MGKAKALLISIVMAALAVAGAATAMRGLSLGPSAPKSPGIAPAALAASRSKLDHWSAELRKQRAAQPPALPGLPHFARVTIPTLAPLPVLVADTTGSAGMTAALPRRAGSGGTPGTIRVAMSKAAPPATDTTSTEPSTTKPSTTKPSTTEPDTTDDQPTTSVETGLGTTAEAGTTTVITLAAPAPPTAAGGSSDEYGSDDTRDGSDGHGDDASDDGHSDTGHSGDGQSSGTGPTGPDD